MQSYIRTYRRRRHLLVKEVAALIGHHGSSSVSRWEHGHKRPCFRNAMKLAVILSCPIEVLFLNQFHQIRSSIRNTRKQLGIRNPPEF
ncbi:MAG: helix-turn-helix transcriptional regulator [Deltaproteobacteria bacterium]|nr:helix-turn-helix transcriptional regulator [Deltaproteobacteria bacterium]